MKTVTATLALALAAAAASVSAAPVSRPAPSADAPQARDASGKAPIFLLANPEALLAHEEAAGLHARDFEEALAGRDANGNVPIILLANPGAEGLSSRDFDESLITRDADGKVPIILLANPGAAGLTARHFYHSGASWDESRRPIIIIVKEAGYADGERSSSDFEKYQDPNQAAHKKSSSDVKEDQDPSHVNFDPELDSDPNCKSDMVMESKIPTETPKKNGHPVWLPRSGSNDGPVILLAPTTEGVPHGERAVDSPSFDTEAHPLA
ncbi:hypothetical protein A4X03_0g6187 [Tilletia caries]|uniref:Uncharacterized protein n=1 Tax=Tilletia caries TaxID=13290 RepID=A0A8T8SZW0_9BASI|nr:hypothetical protein A4X03_0g6187 [Tilletia caries]